MADRKRRLEFASFSKSTYGNQTVIRAITYLFSKTLADWFLGLVFYRADVYTVVIHIKAVWAQIGGGTPYIDLHHLLYALHVVG